MTEPESISAELRIAVERRIELQCEQALIAERDTRFEAQRAECAVHIGIFPPSVAS